MNSILRQPCAVIRRTLWAAVLGACLVMATPTAAQDPGPGADERHLVPHGEDPAPPRRRGGGPDRDAGVFPWRLGKVDLDENDPLLVWWRALGSIQRHTKTIARLSWEHRELLGQFQRLQPPGDQAEPSLSGIAHRRRVKETYEKLHGNMEDIEKAEEKLREVAQTIADNASDIHARLLDVREEMGAESDGDTGRPRAPRRLGGIMRKDRIDASVSLMEEIESEPGAAVAKVLAWVRTVSHGGQEGPGRMPFLRGLEERVGKIEREQVFLRQRLEANDRAIQELQTQIERIASMRGGARGPGRGGPPRLQHVGEMAPHPPGPRHGEPSLEASPEPAAPVDAAE